MKTWLPECFPSSSKIFLIYLMKRVCRKTNGMFIFYFLNCLCNNFLIQIIKNGFYISYVKIYSYMQIKLDSSIP